MVDYSIDESFDLHFNEVHDFATVEERVEFEQDVIIDVHHRLAELTGGSSSQSNLTEKIRLQVARTADKYNAIESIERINIEELFQKPDTVSVEIHYSSGDNFQQTI